MGNSKIDMNILAKRVELLEMRVKELTSVEPEALNERLSKIEERYFSNKEMLTTTEVAEYLGVSQSQIYKLTMNMEIPHYKPQGKTIYFDKKELLKWMRNNQVYEGPDAYQQPAGRVGNPLDIANMVLFLCSEKAGFITGENICIDGGMTRQMIYHGDCGWKLE